MKKYAIMYFPNADTIKYVGSIYDYQQGGFPDPVLMTKEEAETTLKDLKEYVKDEYIGKDDLDNEAAHYAFDKGEWGFAIDEIEIPEDDED